MEGFLGFEPRMVMLKVKSDYVAVKFSRLTWEECWPCPVCVCYTLGFALQLRKKARQKTSVRVAAKCQLGTIQCVDMRLPFAGSHDKLSIPISLL